MLLLENDRIAQFYTPQIECFDDKSERRRSRAATSSAIA